MRLKAMDGAASRFPVKAGAYVKTDPYRVSSNSKALFINKTRLPSFRGK